MQMSASPGDAQDLNEDEPPDRHPRCPPRDPGSDPDRPTQGATKSQPIEAGRYFAKHIPEKPGSLELDSDDHWPYFGDADQVLGGSQEFLTGVRFAPAPETMLATVLCTMSPGRRTRCLAWRQASGTSSSTVITWLSAGRSRVMRTRDRGRRSRGDRCLRRDRPRRPLRLDVRERTAGSRTAHRAGRLHAGEVRDQHDGRPRGVALQVASERDGAAQPGEFSFSGTVKNLKVGSGLDFADRKQPKFPGVPGRGAVSRLENEQSEQVEEPVDCGAGQLSPRRREVAQLLARGLSNKEIAGRLYVSERNIPSTSRGITSSTSWGLALGSRWRLGSPEMST